MKKILALVLASVMLLAMMPAMAEGVEPMFNWFYSDAYMKNSVSGASVPERLDAVKQYIYDQCGIVFNTQIAPSTNQTELLNLALADGAVDCFDAGALGQGGALTLYNLGITENLAPYLDDYPNVKNVWMVAGQEMSDILWSKVTTDDGAIVAIPTSNASSGNCVYVREDILNALGIAIPTTIDELEACLEAVKAAYPDMIPMLFDSAAGYEALAAGFTGEGWSNYYINEEGKVDLYVNAPGMEEYIAKMADWYAKGYIYKEYAGLTDGNVTRELIGSGRVFAFAGWHSNVTGQKTNLESSCNGRMIPLQDLQGPAGYARTMGAASDGGLVIVKGTDEATIRAILAYLDWEFASLDNYMTALYGIIGVDRQEGAPGEAVDVKWDYCADYLVCPMFAFTMQMDSSDPNSVDSYWYYKNMLLDASKSTQNDYVNVSSSLDLTYLSDDTPVDDVARMKSEELTKFIMGARPMTEYADFVAEMEKAGSNEVLDFINAAYEDYLAK